jgi:hypothetical protein
VLRRERIGRRDRGRRGRRGVNAVRLRAMLILHMLLQISLEALRRHFFLHFADGGGFADTAGDGPVALAGGLP